MVSKFSTLRLYVDNAEEKDWQRYLPTGIFYGVTTQPKLLHQAGISFSVGHLAELVNTAFELGANEIHMQVWGRETEPMLKIGQELDGIDQRIMEKFQLIHRGFSALDN